jgi:DNA-binding LytR/AlgR family response regulator
VSIEPGAAAVTALVAEDETVLREELCAHLAALWPELRVVARASNGLEALHMMERYRPDVLFLDIQMPGLNGLEVARQAEPGSHVVFVTAYDAHAVEAFDRGALDYVLKPYDTARLVRSVARIKQRLGQQGAGRAEALRGLAALAPPREHLRWINAAVGAEVKLITVDEVCYFVADVKYTRVVTASGESLIRRSLKELAEQLDPAQFWQVHRSTIVNASAIAGVRRDLRGRVHLKLKQRNETLPVSEPHEHLFRQM